MDDVIAITSNQRNLVAYSSFVITSSFVIRHSSFRACPLTPQSLK